jgi:hypothetical protein
MASYVMYGSEDEGFRFPVGKSKPNLKSALESAKRYLKKTAYQCEDGEPLPTIFTPTEMQIENSGPPICHGKVVRMACIDGDEYISKLDDPEHGYAYDWVYVIKIS